MTTRCPSCQHTFVNVMRRRTCPMCGKSLLIGATNDHHAVHAKADHDDGFDVPGFMVGFATGVPLSPTHGISTGALIGAALHEDSGYRDKPVYPDPAPSTPATPTPAPQPDPIPAPQPSYSSSPDPSPSPSSNFDAGGGMSVGGDGT